MIRRLANLKKVYIDEDRPIPREIVHAASVIMVTIGIIAMFIVKFTIDDSKIFTSIVCYITGVYIFQLLYSIKYGSIYRIGSFVHKGVLKSSITINAISSNDTDEAIYNRCLGIFNAAGIVISEAYIASSNKEDGGSMFNTYSDIFTKHMSIDCIFAYDSIVYKDCLSRNLSENDSSDIAYTLSRRKVCGTNLYAYTLVHWSSIQKMALDDLYRRSDEICSEFDSVVAEMKADFIKMIDDSYMERLVLLNKELSDVIDSIKAIERSLGIIHINEEPTEEEVGA